MRKIFTFFIFLFFSFPITRELKAQNLYFPPLTGSTWDTLAPNSLGWCRHRIDTLYNFLDTNHTKAFIILKDGKLVLEKYFGTFGRDSTHLWASAGKSLTATLFGLAQQDGLLSLNDTVSNLLGNGWTSASSAQERRILLKNLLEMTSGLEDVPTPTTACTNEDDTPACLQYKTTPNSRWAYHTGAYRKLEDAISTAAAQTYNNFTNTRLGNRIGMGGLWVNSVRYSKTRDAARFGLFILNKGIWNGDTILRDTQYFRQMVNSSQNMNPAYGYLWWLNGKSSFMLPGSQVAYNFPLMPNAPTDMFCALGKYDQKIYIVPSQKMVVVRFGDAAGGTNLSASPFDNELWGKINQLSCTMTSVSTEQKPAEILVFPNPAQNLLFVKNMPDNEPIVSVQICALSGICVPFSNQNPDLSLPLDISGLASGLYVLNIRTRSQNCNLKFSKN